MASLDIDYYLRRSGQARNPQFLNRQHNRSTILRRHRWQPFPPRHRTPQRSATTDGSLKQFYVVWKN